MGWKLWLDDQAFDPEVPARHAPEGFRPAASSREALLYCVHFGFPDFVDFDHDLGGDDTAMVFLNELSRSDVFDRGIPAPFEYRVHSANPVGAANIVSFMETWAKMKRSSENENKMTDPYPSRHSTPAVSLEFLQSSGLLFEINRTVLHPVGMALAVVVDDDGAFHENEVRLIQTDDPEGIVFNRGTFEDENGAADRLKRYMVARGNALHACRESNLGFVVQEGPLEGE